MSRETADFAEEVRCKVSREELKSEDDTLEPWWQQGDFWGNFWRTGEATAAMDGSGALMPYSQLGRAARPASAPGHRRGSRSSSLRRRPRHA